jgi:hypothetical protein
MSPARTVGSLLAYGAGDPSSILTYIFFLFFNIISVMAFKAIMFF